MGEITSSDTLHRVMKLAIDEGQAATLAEAQQIFAGYTLAIEVGPDAANSASGQAAILTAVNAARRCFLGGVHVTGPMDAGLRIPWHECRTLGDAVCDLQGVVQERALPEIPRIVVGDAAPTALGPFAVRATWEGWSGGAVPLADTRRLSERTEFTPSGVLAGAVAVAEAFQHVRGGNPLAGRRDAGLSLWQPVRSVRWLEADPGPTLTHLPAKLWVIGLGHLGQACLWTLGFLPYADPSNLMLMLQDVDTLTEANDSTSPLTDLSLLGQKKTRAMAAWAEQRGFRAAIVERLFAKNFCVDDQEPRVAVCSVDNPLARAMLEDVGFVRVVEAGLGTGGQEYLAFQLHTFPGHRTAHQIWDRQSTAGPNTNTLLDRPAYRQLAAAGMDDCGLTQLAGRSVGAAFVGMTTAALVVAELIRMALGAHRYEVIDGSLHALEHHRAMLAGTDVAPFNPGIAPVGDS